MAYASNATHLNTAGESLFARFGSWLMGLGQAVFVARGMEARMTQLHNLQTKTDDELKAMGLKREDLARYVFRDILYL